MYNIYKPLSLPCAICTKLKKTTFFSVQGKENVIQWSQIKDKQPLLSGNQGGNDYDES